MSWRSTSLILLIVLYLAPVVAPVHAEEDQVTRRLVIDGSFVGDLPEPIIDHGGRVFDTFNGIGIQDDEPVFDLPRAGGSVRPWQEDAAPISIMTMVAPGFSRDESEPRLAIFDSQQYKLSFWGDGPIADGPLQQIYMGRTIGGNQVPDAMSGTPYEQPNAHHRIRSGTMLPGLLMVLMEKTVWDLDVEPATSTVTGITIGAMQEAIDGTWSWVWVRDVPNDAPPEAGAYQRLALSSMTAYYPETREEGFLSAFVPFVDYMQHSGESLAIGGQCGLVRVQRSGVGEAWTFGPVKQVVSSWGTVHEHYHVAGWTPNGMVLSIGDSTKSRLALLRCEDWDRYEDSDLWSILPRWQGGVLGGDQVPINQFWACAPGTRLNELLIGGDNVGGSLYAIDVPPPGDDSPAGIRRLDGELSALNLGGVTGNTTSWIHHSRPEVTGSIIARFTAESPGFGFYGRTLMSEDGINFASVARLPQSSDRLAIPVLHGDRILLHRYNGSGLPGFRSTLRPRELPVRRGLLVRPGGVDFLRDEIGLHRPPDSMEISNNFTVVRVPHGEIPEARGWVVPPDAVCYRITGQSTPQASTILRATFEDPRDPASIPSSESFGMNLMVCNLRPSRVILQGEVGTDPIQSTQAPTEDCFACCGSESEREPRNPAVTDRKILHLNSMLDWTHSDIWSEMGPGTGQDVNFRLSDPTVTANGIIDLLVVFRSLTSGMGQPSWAYDPAPHQEVPGDRVEFPLQIRGEEWSAGVEIQIPPEGVDFSVATRVESMPLCTWKFPDGGFVSIRNKPVSGDLVMESGDSQSVEQVFTGIKFSRGDTFRLELRCREGKMRIALNTGGFQVSDIERWEVAAFDHAPTRLLIGGPEGELTGALVVRELWTRTPHRALGVEPFGPVPPRAVDGERRQPGGGVSEGVEGIDPGEILIALGRDDAGLPRNIDLDGDGTVTLLDLEMAVRIMRSRRIEDRLRPEFRGPAIEPRR